jgi:hypothetical protein
MLFVKPFRIYLRTPKSTPQRFVEDYSSEEQLRLREEFKPLAKRYRQRMYAGYAVLGSAFFCILPGMIFPKIMFPWLMSGFFVCWLILLFVVILSPVPGCPACHNKIDLGFGDYCSECGAHALKPGSWMRAPQCSACGKAMRRGKSRGYKIRACTYCGVMLDEKGL